VAQWSDLASLLPPHCRSILDIGCGCGQTLAFCSEVPYRAGVDIDPSAILAASANVPDADFRVARGEALPFPDASFDAVVSCVAFPYMDIRLALRECARVMRPAGVLYLSFHTWDFLKQLWATYPPNFAERVHRSYIVLNGLSFHFFGRVFPYPLRPFLMESFQTEHGLRRSLEDGGFQHICKLPRRVPSFSAVRQQPFLSLIAWQSSPHS
jgi:SAM-dependent methyltransferase